VLIFREMFRESTDSGDAGAVLAAVDAISRATLESTTLEELLPRLLEAFLAHARAAETAVILIREGDRLRVRAVRGFLADEETRAGFSLRVGEGFAGTIAAEGRPRLLAEAAADPLVHSDALRRAGVRALYGVPLAEGGNVIGVAHMGARATDVFPASDLHLFDAMASRASAGISLHRAREQREEATARLEALFESAPVGLGFWDRDLRFLRVNRRLAETNGIPAEAHVGRTPAELFPHVEGLDAIVARWREVLATGRPWIGAEVSGETPARPGERRHWREDFFPVRVGDEVVGLGAVIEEVTDERRADAEAALLARASAELEVATDLEARLERAAALAIPAFADFCGVVLLEEGRPRRVRVHADHPEDAALARELLERRAADLAAGDGVGRVLRQGTSELVEQVGPDFPPPAGRSAAAPHEARRVHGLGLRSYLCVPLRGHRGVLGALAFGTTRSGRRFDARALAVAEELGRRVGLAIDSARLLDEARAEARLREQVMAIVSHDLRTPLSSILLSARIVEARAAPGADGEPLRRAAATKRRSGARMEGRPPRRGRHPAGRALGQPRAAPARRAGPRGRGAPGRSRGRARGRAAEGGGPGPAAGAGRPRSDPAGAREPRLERRQRHRGGRLRGRPGRDPRHLRPLRRAGHRARRRRGRAAADLRALPARRGRGVPRHRPRAGDRPRDRRGAPRRDRGGAAPRRRQRVLVHAPRREASGRRGVSGAHTGGAAEATSTLQSAWLAIAGTRLPRHAASAPHAA
jgi:PAS domain S-box-containing protein